MAPKKNVTEEAFNAFKAEVERHSRYLQYGRGKYQKNRRNRKNYERKIELIEQELNDVEIKYHRVNRQPVHNYKPEPTHITEKSRPIFYGNNRDVHPKDFLYRLEEYFAIKQSYVGEKLITVGKCLKAAASSWFSTIRFQLTNYDDFKKAFIDEFWSREIQIQILSEEGQEDQTIENKSNQQKTNQNDSNNNNQSGQTNSGWNNTRSSGWSNPTPRNNRWNNQPYRSNDRRGDTQQSSQQQTEKINQLSTNKEEQAGPRDNEQHAINLLNTTNQSISPYIQCIIEGEEVTLLVDTGATVSVLTKKVVNIIMQRNPKLPHLPVTRIQISKAVGKKICKVSKQIICECKIDKVYIENNFIQVENLNEKGIIGIDILKKYSTQIPL
ncbi:hypothetical protein AGLY_017322 [Aphis glycines]|uniref:Uncharacterized protein n=1 Tax=Aphis glycines TaxID=307491 RepID=A0A6G0SVD6_APHGL|nr:hypothetical protein AGLY_017322 [Aphis glycines]